MGLRDVFLKHVSLTNPAPMLLEIERAEGVFLYTSTGQRVLDFNSGISVSSLGHGNRRIVDAIRQQAGKYLHTMVYGEHIQAPQVRLAEALCALLPEHLQSVYFVNSGSEAIEGAMKLVKKCTGRPDIVAAKKAYHGSTHGAESLRSDIAFTSAYRPAVPGIRHIAFNRLEDLDRIDHRTAGVIVEVVRAEAGVELPTGDYLRALRDRCTQTGTLLVFDEIQTGCGRTGTRFAFEQYKVQPDILCLAKAFGGGMPLGAFVASKELMNSLIDRPALGHITTFGGHPVSCAAALEALHIWSAEECLLQVQKMEAYLRRRLQHPDIKELRSAGLLIALEMESPERVQRIYQLALKKGIMIDWFLFNWQSIRVAPPLCISEQEADLGVKLLLECIDETA